MKTETNLGGWLKTLGIGRAASVFSADVTDTLSVLQQCGTSESEPLRVVSLTWQGVPPLANELGLLVAALARATLGFFPSLYGFLQEGEPSRWSHTTVESEAHAATRTVPDVDGSACRAILAACHRASIPTLGKLQRAEQAKQFALAIEPRRLLVLIAVLDAPVDDSALKSLAQGAEWLAGNTNSRVVLVLPRELGGHAALDHVTYDSCLFSDVALLNGVPPFESRLGEVPPEERALVSRTAPALAVAREPVIDISPILGRPAKYSDAEQSLWTCLCADERLATLFSYNQHVTTASGSRPLVDVLWERGKLVIEIDGEDHRRPQKFADDRRRDLELTLSGYRVVRFTTSNVIERPDWVIDQIRQVVRYLNGEHKP